MKTPFRTLAYPLGGTIPEQIRNLCDLKHTFVVAILALLEDDEELKTDVYYQHLVSLYQQAHVQHHHLLTISKSDGGKQY